jgi:branched-chain amino acid transport system substrate-binding protein
METNSNLRRNVRRFATLAGGVLAAAAIAACGASNGNSNNSGGGSSSASSSSGSSGSSSSSTPFVVGTVQPLSGTYAAAGLDIVHALKAEANILNAKGGILGHQVKVVSVDDASDPQKAISATQELISNNTLNMFEPDVIYGETQLPLTKNLLSVNLCAGPDCGNGTKYPLDFTLNPPASAQVPPLIAYAKQKGYTKIGILATNDAAGTFFTQTATADAKAAGLSVVGTQSFSPTATDISAEVQALKGTGADTVLTWAAGATIATVMKGMQSVGYTVPVLGTPTVFTAPVEQLVPAAVQKQLICLCYTVGIRTGASAPTALQPLVTQLNKYGTIASMMVTGLTADTLELANYGYTKAGSLDAQKAATAIQAIGSDSSYPATDFWSYRTGAPQFTAANHYPASGPLSQGFYGVAKVSPLVDGMYLGTAPFKY